MAGDVVTLALLFDTYGELLTDKQRRYFDLRYNQDYSLGEIGELEGVSRQAVWDNLSRAEAQLRELEEKTGCVARQRRTAAATAVISAAVEELSALGPQVAPLAKTISTALLQIKE